MLSMNHATRLVAQCSLVLSLALPAMAASPQTFDTDPVLSPVQAPGTWYTDRYAPGAFDSQFFDGDNRLRHGMRVADSAANRPAAYSSSFYNTQGRKYDIGATGAEQTFSIEIYVASDFGTEDRNGGLWATGFNSTNAISAYPIIAYRHGDDNPIWGGSPPAAGFYGWSYVAPGGYAFFSPVTTFDRWYTLSFTLTVGVGVEYFVDGALVGSIADPNTVSLGNVILNAYNFGDENYDVYWDNFLSGTQDIDIDVRPNNSRNQINTSSKQLVPIAILGSAEFDVTDVEIESVSVRGASASATKFEFSDVNGDGFEDLTLFFRARELDPPSPAECSDPDATLTLEGSTSSGTSFEGTDDVTWLGC